MNEERKNLTELIKINFEKAKSILSDKTLAESMLMDSLNEISILLRNKITFNKISEVDGDGDLINYIDVTNTESNYSENLIQYYFHAEKIFPVVIMYQNIIHERCENLSDVENFVKKLVSTESFMIRVIRVSENDYPKIDNDIPF